MPFHIAVPAYVMGDLLHFGFFANVPKNPARFVDYLSMFQSKRSYFILLYIQCQHSKVVRICLPNSQCNILSHEYAPPDNEARRYWRSCSSHRPFDEGGLLSADAVQRLLSCIV